jgi:hypothetical protein
MPVVKFMGVVTSPVFTGGCDSIHFFVSSDYFVTGAQGKYKVEVMQGAAVVWTSGDILIAPYANEEFAQAPKVSGDFQIVISNTTGSTMMMDAAVISIKDICINPAAASAPTVHVDVSGTHPRAAGGYWEAATVTLSGDQPGDLLYYTTDGTAPAATSTPYTAPFVITATTSTPNVNVKAIAVRNALASATLDTTITVAAIPYTITAPVGATVFAGDKHVGVDVAGNYLQKHYIPFRELPAVYTDTLADGRVRHAFDVANIRTQYNYRVSMPGKLTHVGLFRSIESPGVEITQVQLDLHSPAAVDHDVQHLAGRNVADIYLNINAQGHLKLKQDTTFQVINQRNWQAIDTDVNNYFIDPDFHYTVLNLNGTPDNSVLTVGDSGRITTHSAGEAIVLVRYDAMMCAHTTNVGGAPAFFGALWPENTGVFVVSVGAPAESGINANMRIGEYWSTGGTDKVDSTLVDAEHDVLYYEAATGGFDYTFTPEGVTSVTLARPTLGANSTSYSGFSAEGVTAHADGGYTVKLTHGRNIVKLTNAAGVSEYQVLSAKPVTYEVRNATHPGERFRPGDEVSVLFNTLYHPCNKLSGIYNMSAGIQYTGFEEEFPVILGPGQYTFAGKAQTYNIQIPEDYDGEEFALTHGVIKVKGFGSYYGEHRNITKENGVSPNLNAVIRTAYFGTLPDIHVRLTSTFSGFMLNHGAAVALSRTVDLDFTFSDGTPSHFRASENPDNLPNAEWQPYAAGSTTYTFASDAHGWKTVYAQLKNEFGETEVKSDSILYKPLYAKLSLTAYSLNGAAQRTSSREVTLNHTVANGTPLWYSAAEEPAQVGDRWLPYATLPVYTLSEGAGLKTVYLAVANEADTSAIAAAQIYLDESETVDAHGLTARLYPNPVKDLLHVSVEDAAALPVQVTVYDIVGVSCLSQTFHSSSFDLHLSRCPQGVLLVKLQQGNRYVIKRILKR